MGSVSFASRHCKNRAVLLKRATPAERAFRTYLTLQGISFREQQGFYFPFYRIADFYLPDRNPIVEIDGPYHKQTWLQDFRKDLAFLRERGYQDAAVDE